MERKEIINDYMDHGKIQIEDIIDHYYHYVYTIIKNTKNEYITYEDMEEMISDVFVVLWKKSQSLDKNIPIGPYIAGITRNVVRNKYRSMHLDLSLSEYEYLDIDTADIHNHLKEKEQNNIIREALHKIKNEDYQIFMMYYYKDKKIKEISKSLHISESKTKIVLYRVRKKLKKALKKEGYNYER